MHRHHSAYAGVLDNLENEFSYRDQPWLVLEYCSGGALEKWIFDRKPVRNVVLAIQHVTLGLKGIHDRDGFHGDVTPKNLSITYRVDGKWLIKLIDLGLGQAPNPESGSMTRNFRGTPRYIAPEISAGDDYTWRADICSLGLVFRELLTGSTTKLLFDFNPPPIALSRLIDEMTAEDPLVRPSAQIVFDRLENFLATPVIQSKSIQLPERPQGSGWGWVALAALGTVAAIAANANSYDDNVDRWRDSQGRFKSGMFS